MSASKTYARTTEQVSATPSTSATPDPIDWLTTDAGLAWLRWLTLPVVVRPWFPTGVVAVAANPITTTSASALRDFAAKLHDTSRLLLAVLPSSADNLLAGAYLDTSTARLFTRTMRNVTLANTASLCDLQDPLELHKWLTEQAALVHQQH